MTQDDISQFLPQSVAVIEDDTGMLSSICTHLEDLLVKKIAPFEDARKAWDTLSKEKFDLITLDWNLVEMSGLALLNRIRSNSPNEFTPILLISGFLDKKDFTLLSELPFTNSLEKPFASMLFRSKITSLMKEVSYYNSQCENLEDLLKKAVSQPDIALSSLLEFAADSPRPTPFAITAIRTLVKQGHLFEAEVLTRSLLEREPESIMALGELGKILLLKKKFDEAITVLEKARQKSPENTERLCLMSEAFMEKMDIDNAAKHIESAEKIDPSDERVVSGKILTKNVSDYLGQDSITSIPKNFASLLNAIGISMVKSLKHEKGIEHYQSAIKYISDNDIKAKLSFNCGLGFMRWGKRQSALLWFKEAIKLSDGKFDKASSYARKITEKIGDSATDASLSNSLEFGFSDDDEISDFDEGVIRKAE